MHQEIVTTENHIDAEMRGPKLREFLSNPTTLAAFAFLVSTMNIYHTGLSERYHSPLLLGGISGSILLSLVSGTTAQFFLQMLSTLR